ncbi:sorting nexin-15 isoform X1 [Dunckerocampus dactyliophorus]|uniref:sorting nexin-15 isoform X1 n=1 Tax=Dunckerocampus dactyliophorus TaxID=161453 RepID=UPI002406F710|nr:sorting nexin-15 isoform X1 [Dunckerocampus dactyliophorus]
MSRKAKEEYYRFFSVTETRTHEKGHTEYKVTARFVSKPCPDDVKEVVLWKRYSELKKLHGELAYTHRNLFRRQEEFPPFPPAQVFGRFDEAVIEERRRAAETMLVFTTSIPALYNSPQMKEFFIGGEVTRPQDLSLASSTGPLPPPLIPLPKQRASDCEPAEEEVGREAPTLPQDLGTNLSIAVGKPEVAVEAYSEMGDDAREGGGGGVEDKCMDAELCEKVASLTKTHRSQDSQEESLFDSVADKGASSPKGEAPPPLSDRDLAVFDPCYKPDAARHSGGSPMQPTTTASENPRGNPAWTLTTYGSGPFGDHSKLLSLPASSLEKEAAYLNRASAELSSAMEREKDGDVSAAICSYRTAVDILITGVQGDPDPARKDSVKRRIAQYLEHAEMLLDSHTSPTGRE